jgi:hypothetical protein
VEACRHVVGELQRVVVLGPERWHSVLLEAELEVGRRLVGLQAEAARVDGMPDLSEEQRTAVMHNRCGAVPGLQCAACSASSWHCCGSGWMCFVGALQAVQCAVLLITSCGAAAVLRAGQQPLQAAGGLWPWWAGPSCCSVHLRGRIVPCMPHAVGVFLPGLDGLCML